MSNHRQGLVLSVNAGSSSLKISLFKPAVSNHQGDVADLILESSIDNLSSPPARFTLEHAASSAQGKNVKKEPKDNVKDHSSAFSYFLDHLENEAGFKRSDIVHVCHRVVHGGDYSEPVVISEETYHHIEKLTDLAPLHNGAALAVIHTCIKKTLPNASSIAYFDTTFHHTLPQHISSYAIDQSVARPRGLKKYGFHGISYAYILRAVSSFLRKPQDQTNLIVLHLGSGASACAIQNGNSVDTSMGLTPVHGLPGATRSGEIDPSLIFHYTNKAGRISHDPSHTTNVGVTEAEEILNKQSGWKAIAGTADFAEVVKRDSDDKRLAFDIFADRILSYIGSYFVTLQGEVDALVFAGGIGEKSSELRSFVSERVRCLGFQVDQELNQGVTSKEGVVVEFGETGRDEKVRTRRLLVCRTDEQYEMARECLLEDKFWR